CAGGEEERDGEGLKSVSCGHKESRVCAVTIRYAPCSSNRERRIQHERTDPCPSHTLESVQGRALLPGDLSRLAVRAAVAPAGGAGRPPARRALARRGPLRGRALLYRHGRAPRREEGGGHRRAAG